MAKKKNKNPKAALPDFGQSSRKPPARSIKASMDSRLNATIMSAPRRLKVDDASVFMRTTAFAIKNKISTAFTELGGFDLSRKNRKARAGLKLNSSSQPSSSSFFARPVNRLKAALLTLLAVGGVGGYLYFDRASPEFNGAVDSLSQAVPEMGLDENVYLPVADEALNPPAQRAGMDVLPVEPSLAPKAVAAPGSKVKGKASKAVKTAKKKKTGKAKTKAKSKSRSNAKKSASR